MKFITIFICLILFIGCSTDTQTKLKWYKGNLHTHSYWSDGDEFPEVVLDWYQSHGYDFIALSDHNTISENEKWIVVQKSPLYEQSFQAYLKKFGEDWVEYKTDTGRIQVKLKTYSQYKEKLGKENFLIIHSEEITDRANSKPVHLNATNIQEFVAPQGGTTVAETMQNNIDAVLEQRKKLNIPMFPHINHPNFGWAVTVDDLISLKGERFFEVYNGHPMVHNYGDSARISTEIMWDKINLAYAKRNQPLLFGLATDDSHNYHQFGSSFSNSGRGWVMVQAESLTPESLITAMEAGQFYSSTGVMLKAVNFMDGEINVEVEPEPGINYTIEFIGADKSSAEVSVLQKSDGLKNSFKVGADYSFVRARITSTKPKENPFQDGDFEMAWTQPVQNY
jgi:hypothetical protein